MPAGDVVLAALSAGLAAAGGYGLAVTGHHSTPCSGSLGCSLSSMGEAFLAVDRVAAAIAFAGGLIGTVLHSASARHGFAETKRCREQRVLPPPAAAETCAMK